MRKNRKKKNFFKENNIPNNNKGKWLFSGLTITECKIAINNRWNEFQIINKCVEYRNFKKINIIEVKKSELDSSLDILENILDGNKTTFKSLPEDYKKDKIDKLIDDFLPHGAKQNDLKKAISDKRNIFRYKINEPNNKFDNDSLDSNKYEKILKSINETEKIVFDKWKNKVTPEFLNKFLEKFINRSKDKNLENWLRENKIEEGQNKLLGYTLHDKPIKKIRVAEIRDRKFTGNIINDFEISGDEVEKIKNNFDKSLSGTYKLPYIFDLIDFNPEKLKNVDGSYNLDNFAKIKEVSIKTKIGIVKRKIVDVDRPGILPILTGSGKTTKLVRCLLICIFPGKHIILITSNEELAADAKNHHNVKNRSLASWINKNKERTVVDNVNSDIFQISEEETSSGMNIDELHDLPNSHENFEQAKIQIKKKLLDKENTIIIFDEAHFPNTSYQ
ncbi:2430_t:CDS:2, partial [Scutellospora calospora]